MRKREADDFIDMAGPRWRSVPYLRSTLRVVGERGEIDHAKARFGTRRDDGGARVGR